jgi:polyamine oxidase
VQSSVELQGGDHSTVHGLKAVVSQLSQGVPIRFGAIAQHIAVLPDSKRGTRRAGQAGGRVRVTLVSGEAVQADSVVVTVPLGVLKAGDLAFDPPLPAWKTAAIAKVGFGHMDKVVLKYVKPFWPAQTHWFGLNSAEAKTTRDDDLRCLHRARRNVWVFSQFPVTGEAVLVALITGKLSQQLRSQPKQDSVAYVRRALARMFGGSSPEPLRSRVIRWGEDRFAKGAYSFLKTGSSAEDLKQLARPVAGGRVHFAGEHTAHRRPGYMDGAFNSGRREADRIINGFAKRASRDRTISKL